MNPQCLFCDRAAYFDEEKNHYELFCSSDCETIFIYQSGMLGCVNCKKKPNYLNPVTRRGSIFCSSYCNFEYYFTFIFTQTPHGTNSYPRCRVCPNEAFRHRKVFLPGCCNSHCKLAENLGFDTPRYII